MGAVDKVYNAVRYGAGSLASGVGGAVGAVTPTSPMDGAWVLVASAVGVRVDLWRG